MGKKSREKKERKAAGIVREKRVKPEPLTHLTRYCACRRRQPLCQLCNGWGQQKKMIGSGDWLPLRDYVYEPPKMSRGTANFLAASAVLAGPAMGPWWK